MANYHPESKVSGSEIFIKSGTSKLGKSSLSVRGFSAHHIQGMSDLPSGNLTW